MKKVLLLLAVLVVLSGVWWFLGRREESMQQSGVPPQATQVDTLTLNRIVLERHNLPTITFEKDAGGFWTITEPVKDKANLNLAVQLEKGLAQLKFVNRISERSSQHAAFQIDEASGAHLQAFAGDAKQADVYLGKVTPDRMHVYAREAGSDVVYSATGGGALAAMRTRDLDSFRSRDVLEREPSSFDSVDVRSGAMAYRLVRVDSSTWDIRIGASGARRANTAAVEGFLKALGKVKASGFRPDSVAVDWSRPGVSISAWLLGEPVVTLDLQPGPNTTYYLRASTRSYDMAVFESVYKTFQQDPKDFLAAAPQGS